MNMQSLITLCFLFHLVASDLSSLRMCFKNYLSVSNIEGHNAAYKNCTKNLMTDFVDLGEKYTVAQMTKFVQTLVISNQCLLGRTLVECNLAATTVDVSDRLTALAEVCVEILADYESADRVESYPGVCNVYFDTKELKESQMKGVYCQTDQSSNTLDFTADCAKLLHDGAILQSESKNPSGTNIVQIQSQIYCDSTRLNTCAGRQAIATVCDQSIAYDYVSSLIEVYTCAGITPDQTVQTYSTTTPTPLSVGDASTENTSGNSAVQNMPFGIFGFLVSLFVIIY